MSTADRFPVSIPVHPYLRDHVSYGRIVFPAVEILQWLAASAQARYPDAPVHCMRDATFDRFLPIDKDQTTIAALGELSVCPDGLLAAQLLTSALTPGQAVRRTKIHATVAFAEFTPSPLVPMDVLAALDGIVSTVDTGDLYRDLVPFGPAYRNLAGPLYLAEDGALGTVRAAEYPAPTIPLGSPFPLDAAMHAACAWGQRYSGIIAYPVAFRQRVIHHPTRPGEEYLCRILPRSIPAEPRRDGLTFDILIFSRQGELCEDIRGILMKDVSGGRAVPPDWIRAQTGVGPAPATLRAHCRELALIDLETLTDAAACALTPAERGRFVKMGPRRKQGYLAGRLALKRLTRKLSGDVLISAADLETVMPDGVRPVCSASPYASLSHDSRYAVAVADDEPIGVDVEAISDRVQKSVRLFMTAEEMAIVKESPLGHTAAALRVWSIKECVSKAIDRPLADCWQCAAVKSIGGNESSLTVDGTAWLAVHDEINGRLFTVVKRK